MINNSYITWLLCGYRHNSNTEVNTHFMLTPSTEVTAVILISLVTKSRHDRLCFKAQLSSVCSHADIPWFLTSWCCLLFFSAFTFGIFIFFYFTSRPRNPEFETIIKNICISGKVNTCSSSPLLLLLTGCAHKLSSPHVSPSSGSHM